MPDIGEYVCKKKLNEKNCDYVKEGIECPDCESFVAMRLEPKHKDYVITTVSSIIIQAATEDEAAKVFRNSTGHMFPILHIEVMK